IWKQPVIIAEGPDLSESCEGRDAGERGVPPGGLPGAQAVSGHDQGDAAEPRCGSMGLPDPGHRRRCWSFLGWADQRSGCGITHVPAPTPKPTFFPAGLTLTSRHRSPSRLFPRSSGSTPPLAPPGGTRPSPECWPALRPLECRVQTLKTSSLL